MTLPQAARGQPAVRVIKKKAEVVTGLRARGRGDPLGKTDQVTGKKWFSFSFVAVTSSGSQSRIDSSLPSCAWHVFHPTANSKPDVATPPRQARFPRVSVTECPRPRLRVRPVITASDRHFVLLNSLSVWLILQRLACKSSCQRHVSRITYLWGNW